MAPLNNHNNSAKIMSACSFLFSISFILSSINLFHQYFFSLQYFPFSVPLVIDGSVISNIMSHCLSALFQCLIVSILFVRTFVIFFSSVNFYLDSNFAPYFPSFSKHRAATIALMGMNFSTSRFHIFRNSLSHLIFPTDIHHIRN